MRNKGFIKKIVAAVVSFSVILGCAGSIAFGEPATDTIPGTTKTINEYDTSFLSVTGFAEGHVNDRTEYIGKEQYVQVANELEFLQAISDASKGKVKVIEVVNDLDLGYAHLSDEAKEFSFISDYAGGSTAQITNPGIIESGLSQITFNNIDGLTIFSKGGATISRAEWKLQGSSKDIIVRNLNFDSLWHWSEDASTKESGWTCMKVNGAKGVWFDHCSFTLGADGNCDAENGAENLSYTWCTFGMPTTEDPDKRSALYQTVTYMEYLYQRNQLSESGRYYKMRKDGATFEQILAYEAFHSKAFLVGSGDKDYKDNEAQGLQDGNQRLEITMAYNYMMNLGQRVVRMRQGKGHLFNCYVDNMAHHKLADEVPALANHGGWNINRCIDVHNGGSVAADTCVFNGVNQVIIGSETNGAGGDWGTRFKNVYNYSMVVNSKVTNTSGDTYTGSSWDNGGNNLFYNGYGWFDRSTLGQFCWNTTIVGVEDMKREDPPTPAAPFEFNYDFNYQLPYEYQVVALEDVEEVVTTHAGAYKYCEEPEFWLRTEYEAGEDIKPAAEKEAIEVTGFIANYDELKVSLGNTAQLITKIVPSYATDREVTYTSSNPDVASVTDSGLVAANNYGTTDITISSANGVKKVVKVEVYQAVIRLKLDSSSKTIYTGSDFTLTPAIEPENATNKEVTWKSSDESVATVENGIVHPVAPGRTNITCTSVDDPSLSATCRVTVKAGTATEPPVDTDLKGDVNGDETVNAVDALMVLKHAAKIELLSDEKLAIADLNEDTKIDAVDALTILKIAAKLI